MHAHEWLTRRRAPVDRPAGVPNPFEAAVLSACSLIGGIAVVGYAQPAAFEDVLPRWGRLLWGALMFLGGVTSIAGLYWPFDPIDGVIIKRVGLTVLAPLMAAYGLAGIITDPQARAVASLFALAISAACVVRIRQVTRAIRGLHGQLRGLREEWENGADP